MMTALAFVFGVMPMLFATGAGANSRVALGTAVVFGMAINAIIGSLFVPNFWAAFQKFQEKYLSKMFAGADETGDRQSFRNHSHHRCPQERERRPERPVKNFASRSCNFKR